LRNKFEQKYVLNSEDERFDEDLTKALDELKPLIFFEFVGGDLSSRIFPKMLPNSEMIVVGNLLNQPSKFDLFDIFLKDKKIRGLFVLKWLPNLS